MRARVASNRHYREVSFVRRVTRDSRGARAVPCVSRVRIPGRVCVWFYHSANSTFRLGGARRAAEVSDGARSIYYVSQFSPRRAERVRGTLIIIAVPRGGGGGRGRGGVAVVRERGPFFLINLTSNECVTLRGDRSFNLWSSRALNYKVRATISREMSVPNHFFANSPARGELSIGATEGFVYRLENWRPGKRHHLSRYRRNVIIYVTVLRFNR